MPPPIYLDWNATTPPHPEVAEAMLRALAESWGNPASVHRVGRRARALIEDTRELLARSFQLSARDVLFTSGGTEANNLALSGAVGLAVSRIEHPSVVRAAEAAARAGVPVEWLPVGDNGVVHVEGVVEALTRLPTGATVALMAANHETGVIQPVAEVVRVARERGARVHVDAVQFVGKRPLSGLLGADSYAVAAHKIRGPKGIGALLWRPPWLPKPLLLGGSQERGLRPGTVDPVLAAGFGAAWRRLEDGPARYARLGPWRDSFEQALEPWGTANGRAAERLPHVSNWSFPRFRGDELVAALDLLGVCVSSGSACSAGTTEASPVITAMAGEERARSAVRISCGEETTEEELAHARAGFVEVLSRRPSRTT